MRSKFACLSTALSLTLITGQFAYAQDPEPQEAVEEAADPADELAAAGDLPLDAEQIRSYQLELKARGYFFGPVDGRKGPRTRAALRNFQRAEGLTPSGSLDQATLERLSEPANGSAATLHESAPVDEDPTAPSAGAGDVASPAMDPSIVDTAPSADAAAPADTASSTTSAPDTAAAPTGTGTVQSKSVSGQPGGVKRFFGTLGGGIKKGVGAVVGVGPAHGQGGLEGHAGVDRDQRLVHVREDGLGLEDGAHGVGIEAHDVVVVEDGDHRLARAAARRRQQREDGQGAGHGGQSYHR